MKRLSNAPILTAALVLSVSAWAAGDETNPGDGRQSDPAAAYKAESQDLTWTDASRNRDIPVRIYAPTLDRGPGPFPVVVFSHGGGESREASTRAKGFCQKRP